MRQSKHLPRRPNFLILMCDQLQARVLEPSHLCRTQRLDELAARGAVFARAYTPNPICSPARASLMTGLLPHNHGVETNLHTQPGDRGGLRSGRLHFAQRLKEAGYRTAYVGAWHVERSNDLHRYGWDEDYSIASDTYRARIEEQPRATDHLLRNWTLRHPRGYDERLLCGVSSVGCENRSMGVVSTLASSVVKRISADSGPWCCFVGTNEPHDPFLCGAAAFSEYREESVPLPESLADAMTDKPQLYRRAASIFTPMTIDDRRFAAACYYASITELDGLLGRVIDTVEEIGQLDDTIVILTADHGELLSAHGLYHKNISAFEEVYNIPLIVAGPGVDRGRRNNARVGLHDLHPTICDLAGVEPAPQLDSRSFAGLLRDATADAAGWRQGYAEYSGSRLRLTQRVVWAESMKLVFNGFATDELYDLSRDPNELQNLAERPEYRSDLDRMTTLMWHYARASNDRSLLHSSYPPLRIACVGPTSL